MELVRYCRRADESTPCLELDVAYSCAIDVRAEQFLLGCQHDWEWPVYILTVDLIDATKFRGNGNRLFFNLRISIHETLCLAVL